MQNTTDHEKLLDAGFFGDCWSTHLSAAGLLESALVCVAAGRAKIVHKTSRGAMLIRIYL
jgi:hypothetical protein